jgi:hypothetical protein
MISIPSIETFPEPKQMIAFKKAEYELRHTSTILEEQADAVQTAANARSPRRSCSKLETTVRLDSPYISFY